MLSINLFAGRDMEEELCGEDQYLCEDGRCVATDAACTQGIHCHIYRSLTFFPIVLGM